MTRQIIHIDMDAFYASVEQLDNPTLVGKAVIVGGAAEARGVVSAASYEARKFGVHSAMPMGRATRLCPQAVVLPVRMQRYVELSRQIRNILDRYTTKVEPISIDEAFLDVTNCVRFLGPATTIGRNINNAIKEEVKLTASVGIAPNKFLAKLASDLHKPDGFVVITEENKQEILDPLSVSKIWGVGKATEKTLLSHGIKTIADLRTQPLASLKAIVGNCAADLLALAQGEDDRQVETETQAKSLSSEETFATDIVDYDALKNVLFGQVQEVAERLRHKELQANTIVLKLRYGDFRTLTRSKSLTEPTATTEILWQVAKEVFQKWYDKDGGALRLIGFGVSGLVSEQEGQKTLFEDPLEKKHKSIDKTVDAIRQKFGRDALKRGQ